MATFAERFKKIQKKYFDKSSTGELVPPNSKTTMAAFDSEVQSLFKEQEALKAEQQQEPQQGMPPQQFAMGGTLPSVGNIFGGGGSTGDDTGFWRTAKGGLRFGVVPEGQRKLSKKEERGIPQARRKAAVSRYNPTADVSTDFKPRRDIESNRQMRGNLSEIPLSIKEEEEVGYPILSRDQQGAMSSVGDPTFSLPVPEFEEAGETILGGLENYDHINDPLGLYTGRKQNPTWLNSGKAPTPVGYSTDSQNNIPDETQDPMYGADGKVLRYPDGSIMYNNPNNISRSEDDMLAVNDIKNSGEFMNPLGYEASAVSPRFRGPMDNANQNLTAQSDNADYYARLQRIRQGVDNVDELPQSIPEYDDVLSGTELPSPGQYSDEANSIRLRSGRRTMDRILGNGKYIQDSGGFDYEAQLLDSIATDGTQDNAKVSFQEGMRNTGKWLGDNQEMIGLAGSAIAPIASKLIARNSIDDARRIDPTEYIPSVNSKWFDSTPMETQFQQNNATAINSMANSTGDFDSLMKGAINSTYSTNMAMGQGMMEGQKLNMTENARIDSLISEATKYNAGMNSQADIDQVSRQDNIDQIKRGYTVGIGDDLGGVFNDIAASKLAKEISAEKSKLARLTAENK